MDTIVNFLYATIADTTVSSGATTINVTAGHGARFGSSFPFDVVIYSATYSNAVDAYLNNAAEIVRVTARTTDALTVTRAQQSTTARGFVVTDKIIQAPTSGLLAQLIATSLLTTRGDIIKRDASAPARLALGAAGLSLVSDGTDPAWTGLGGGDMFSADTTDFERWHTPGTVGPLSARTPTKDRMYSIPFFVTQPCVVSALSFNVTTLQASTNGRVGIYLSKSVSNFYPGTLLVDGGAVATDTTGVKTASGLSTALTPNRWHWLVYLCSGAPAASVSGPGSLLSNLGCDTAFSATTTMYVAQTYGSLPGTYPATPTFSTSATWPTCAIKLSSIT